MILKKKIPACHSADLIFVLFLPVTFVDVSFCPFSITGRDLFNSDSRVFAVVTVLVKVWVGSAVRQGRVEESTSRSTESFLHSSGVVAELDDPFFLRRKLGKMIKKDFFGELVQAVQTLLRGSRWNLNLQVINFLQFRKNGEAKIAVKLSQILIIDAKLRFALLVSLCSMRTAYWLLTITYCSLKG